jgi:phage/plasmid-associated DNA primase
MVETMSFVPQFKMILLANNLMEIKSQDHGTWRRIRVVDFMSLFTDNPVEGDKDKPYQFKKEPIVEKFDDWKEVFMALLVKKALETDGKVEICSLVTAASDAYRQKQDTISEFIAEKIVLAEGYTLKKTELNFQFTNWHKNTYGNNGPNAKEVHAYLEKKFSKCTTNGWVGIRIKHDVNQDEAINDSDLDEPVF